LTAMGGRRSSSCGFGVKCGLLTEVLPTKLGAIATSAVVMQSGQWALLVPYLESPCWVYS
jgi:hypothetical protein